jgi:hypothetical protein
MIGIMYNCYDSLALEVVTIIEYLISRCVTHSSHRGDKRTVDKTTVIH